MSNIKYQSGPLSQMVSSLDPAQLIADDRAFMWTQAWSEKTWRQLLHGKIGEKYYCCIALVDDGLAGWSLASLQDPELTHLLKIVVRPIYQGLGLGAGLLECLYGLSRPVFLEVAVDNYNAISLYKKTGFKELVRVKSYYTDGRDAFRMIKH
jgi:ribosomal protein S18 acetylase RimI-like enzyme